MSEKQAAAGSRRLPTEQVAWFKQEGFLLYKQPVFPQGEFDALKAHFELKLAALPPGQRPEAMDVPHSHNTGKKGYSDYERVDTSQNVFPVEIVPRQRTDKQGVPCSLDPNECSLHDARAIHGSAANTSTKRRCGYTMRYMGTHVQLAPDVHDLQKVYLARGRAKAHNPWAEPGQDHSDLHQKRAQSLKKFH